MLKNQTKSGNYFCANTTITPYYDTEGKTVGHMYVGRAASESQIKAGEQFYLNPKAQQSGFTINPKKILYKFKIKTKLLFVFGLMAIMMMVLGINLILIKKTEYEDSFNRLKGAEYNLSLAKLMRLTAKLVSSAQDKQTEDTNRIVESVHKINENSLHILNAASQEKIAVEEISKSIETIATGTQVIADNSLVFLKQQKT